MNQRDSEIIESAIISIIATGNIELLIKEADRLLDLYRPLAQVCMPQAENLDYEGWPKKHRYIYLNKNKYKKQYNAGITECCGLQIYWIG